MIINPDKLNVGDLVIYKQPWPQAHNIKMLCTVIRKVMSNNASWYHTYYVCSTQGKILGPIFSKELQAL